MCLYFCEGRADGCHPSSSVGVLLFYISNVWIYTYDCDDINNLLITKLVHQISKKIKEVKLYKRE